ncbi:hypothetical protein GCM10008024_33970 [Allgaiera indica]|uniref:Tripartite ATP-independent transporter, DctM component n=1 Tax=Allgaiera indica TaxID=765699 RepID=A0AAN4UV48_9RHOB|nr:hypothetical protein GCM10008024_33970 [Allgaiera indica]SDX59830.1 Tripartite ATP-independent transporter, DctM component [Allgaiera indica]
MGQVALPEMRKRGYFDALSTGVLAAGGTLGILIPPSVVLVIYAILALTRAPEALTDWVTHAGLSPYMILLAIQLCYLIFGCVMDSVSMILLTIPIFFLIAAGLDFGLTPEETAIWFGVLALIVVEVGLITPPVGMNLFIINNVARGIPISRTYRGVAPFVLSDLVRVALLVGFPGLTLWLVRLMF